MKYDEIFNTETRYVSCRGDCSSGKKLEMKKDLK